MKNAKKQSNKRTLKALATVRGLERKAHFENGGTLSDWRGGVHTITKNRKKEQSRKACRQWRA
jgi:hypothetical protein